MSVVGFGEVSGMLFGVENGVYINGLDFLARTASEYGCFLVFDQVEFGSLDSPPQGKAKWEPKRGFNHRKPSDWLRQLRKNFSVLDDLSSLIQNLHWAAKSDTSVRTERVGETLLSFARNDSESRSLSVFLLSTLMSNHGWE